jgi:succinate dehydrogenase/fumarate reductase flavoprotein subunit
VIIPPPSPVHVWAEVQLKYARPYPPVAKTMEIVEGRGVGPDEDHIYLHLNHLSPEHLMLRFF